MEKITFVILHYKAIELTIKCIESLKMYLSNEYINIVVIDNGSKNGTGQKLEELYSQIKNIKIICLDNNLGFSAGNNVGYVYAREELCSDFIIIMNNDTEMIQTDFVEKIIDCYSETSFFVMGPDIINLDGMHQSPQRNHVITLREAKKWYIKRWLFTCYLYIHKFFRLSEKFFIYKNYVQHDEKRKGNFNTNIRQTNVELQGACFIFSPNYVKKNKIAFEELTFMYGEEALLAIKCAYNGWEIIYNPDIKILHAERATTKMVCGNNIETEIFWSKSHVKAIRKIIKYMEERKSISL